MDELPKKGVENWVVIRCAGQSTITQTEDLKLQGIDAWTPVYNQRKRLPRTKQTIMVRVACLPSYVFADASKISQLEAMKQGGKLKGQLMKCGLGLLVRVKDFQLESLKMASQPCQSDEVKTPKPAMKSHLKLTEGPFQGMMAQVVGLTPSHALLSILGENHRQFFPLQIKYSLLDKISVHATIAL
jgi:hypothetical protein